MKRSLVVALIVGAIVSAIVIALHATRHHAAARGSAHEPAARAADDDRKPSGVSRNMRSSSCSRSRSCWLVLNSSRRKRLGWPLGILALELIAVSWVCLLYQVFFQPIPSLLAVGLGFVTATVTPRLRAAADRRSRYDLFGGRLSEEQLARMASGELKFEREARSYESTAVVCDIANKHDLADEGSPAELSRDHGEIHPPRDAIIS